MDYHYTVIHTNFGSLYYGITIIHHLLKINVYYFRQDFSVGTKILDLLAFTFEKF